MKPLSEVAPGLLVIQIQVQAVCYIFLQKENLTWGTRPCRFLREICEWPPWPLLLASFLARTSWLRPLSILGRMTLRPFLPRSVLTKKKKRKNKFNIRWQNGQELKDIALSRKGKSVQNTLSSSERMTLWSFLPRFV